MQCGTKTKNVLLNLKNLLKKIGAELYILRNISLADLEEIGGSLLAEAVQHMHIGKVLTKGGYDGQFGTTTPIEHQQINGQKQSWSLPSHPINTHNYLIKTKKHTQKNFSVTSPIKSHHI